MGVKLVPSGSDDFGNYEDPLEAFGGFNDPDEAAMANDESFNLNFDGFEVSDDAPECNFDCECCKNAVCINPDRVSVEGEA